MRRLKAILQLMVALLPPSPGKNRLLNRFGHDVHPTARIQPFVLLRVGRLVVGARTRIGRFTVLRGLHLFEIGADSSVGKRNDFRANLSYRAVAEYPHLAGVFRAGDFVFIGKRHILDCSGGVVLGDRSAIGGREVFVYTHSYDPELDLLVCEPTIIAANAMVATKSVLAMGATLPERSILAMGAVLLPGATRTDTLYGGVPARPLDVDVSGWKVFTRPELTAPKGRRPSSRQRPEVASVTDHG